MECLWYRAQNPPGLQTKKTKNVQLYELNIHNYQNNKYLIQTAKI